MNTSGIHGFVSFTVIQNVECYFPFHNILGPNSIIMHTYFLHTVNIVDNKNTPRVVLSAMYAYSGRITGISYCFEA